MGCQVKSKNATFTFYNKNSYETDNITQDSFKIFVTSKKNPDKDNIRSVKDIKWDDMWNNELENVFSPKGVSLDKAKEYMLSIGMIEYTPLQIEEEWGVL